MENQSSPQRIIALDVFRGMTIALMFIVNNPGTWTFIYPPFQHAKWQGWTPTDFVYPFFLFTVGVAAWFSLKKYQTTRPDASVYWKIIRRGGTIFLIGLLLGMYLNSLSSYENLRIMGVLQRIGLAYILGGIICVTFSRSITAVIGVAILVGYWLTMKWFGDPSYPFGWHDGTAFLGIKENLVTKVDLWAMGAKHLYKGFGTPFDPEGLLSTLPSVVTMIVGYLTGNLIDSENRRRILVVKMLGLGVICLFIGWLLNEKWVLGEWAFPISKPVWSPTYVIFMGGWCLVINAVLVALIDVLNFKSWTKPFLVLGMNSLLAFVIAGMFVKTLNKIKFDSEYETTTELGITSPKKIGGSQKLYETFFIPITLDKQTFTDFSNKKITAKETPKAFQEIEEKQKMSSFLFALFHMFLFWAILYLFYWKKIFLKV